MIKLFHKIFDAKSFEFREDLRQLLISDPKPKTLIHPTHQSCVQLIHEQYIHA